jgi:glycerol uptake facilitator-like aquaporin
MPSDGPHPTMAADMRRRLAAEALGSLLLAATVIGSGVMAQRLAAGNMAIALLANTCATLAVLAVLIALLSCHHDRAFAVGHLRRHPAA